MEYDLDQSRNWYRDSLPLLKPTSFIAKRDMMILDNGFCYIWDGSWKLVTNPLKGTDGKDGTNGTNGTNGIDGTNGLNGRDGIDGADGVCPPCPPTSGGSTNLGMLRFVSTEAEFRAACAETNVRSIHLVNNLVLTQEIILPLYFTKILEIDGHGHSITTSKKVFTRKYPSLSEANKGIDMQLRLSNIEFISTSNRTEMCIDLEANYGAKIEGCRFSNFSTAFKGGWTMGTIIEQCYFWENNISIDFDYARFTNGSNSASQSNHSVVKDCKFRHSAGQFGAIKATAVSGLVIDHCIFEGIQAGPQYEIFFDDNGSTVVKEFTVKGCHIEQQPSIAGIHVRLKDGYAKIDTVFSQYDCTLISFDSAGYGKCIVSTVPYLTAGTKFNNINPAGRWKFIDPPATFLITDASKWVGAIPTYLSIEGWDTSGQKSYMQGVTVK